MDARGAGGGEPVGVAYRGVLPARVGVLYEPVEPAAVVGVPRVARPQGHLQRIEGQSVGIRDAVRQPTIRR
jgi:hypothetical protein